MGHRPSRPDSLPVIGPSPGFRDVYFAFGHSHTGLTAAPITGRLMADLVAGRAPQIDIAPFRIDRFCRPGKYDRGHAGLPSLLDGGTAAHRRLGDAGVAAAFGCAHDALYPVSEHEGQHVGEPKPKRKGLP